MEINLLMSIIEQYGYLAIFFLLWLGIVGLPIPDELVVATGGFLVSIGLLDPVYSFLAGYLGVASGLTIGFLLGKFFGKPILQWLSKSEKMRHAVERSTELLRKYGTSALCISYLFPVVRHVVPYLVAMGGMTYRRYALLSYPIGLVWTIAFYLLGYVFGNHVEAIVVMIRHYGFYTLLVLVALLVIGLVIRKYVMGNRAYRAKGE
ncbi:MULTISPECIES: DedA family protein [Brevibacillus]|jgi:membrane protein DedA with SNARE-associated domain|nr:MULTISPECIES: DedA family protein [Brevibacillus]MDR7317901.1 membrane protein DedA with SNARE-associated domain [Brevibacillus nitrificans]MEC2131550.1 DedA family protein [Brevibacillus centrosporus]MED1792982.1 DedA family protein [Brevibacillus nitrificans]MED1952754.1 DedA family protein [Brevibacillus centrosporus]MED4907794.1 DedA family protein [Brevibacillus centrosporus]